MNESSDNIIVKKSYSFALDVVKMYKFLANDKKEYVLSKQFLRSGTSIGANIHEAIASVSKRDFVHKLGIAVKEVRETSYWLNLLKDTEYISENNFQLINQKSNELTKILNSIILTTKERYFKSQ